MKLKITVFIFLIVHMALYSVAQDSDNWEFIGPENIFLINGIRNEPGTPIFAYSLTGDGLNERVYRSPDNGPVMWDVIFEEPRDDRVVTFDLHIHTGDIYFLAASTGLLRTIDGGLNWTPTSLGDLRINDVAAANNGRLAAAGARKYFISVDDGDTWTSSTISAFSGSPREISFDGKGGTWCLDSERVYLSVDDGKTWATKYTRETPSAFLSQLAIDSRGNVLFSEVDTFFIGGLSVIYRSVDDGESWDQVLNFIPANSEMLATRTGSIYLVAGDNIWLSTDGGDTWEKAYTVEAFSAPPRSLHINSNGQLFVGTALGIFRSKFLLPGFNGAAEWNSYP